MSPSTRHAVLRALVPLLLLTCLPGCAPPADRTLVRVLGPWTGAEEDRFRAVLDRTGVPYDYTGSRALGQLLRSRVQQGDPPDVAVLPGLGELADYARGGYLRELPSLPEADYAPLWRDVARVGAEGTHAVVVKADLKSLIWFDPDSDVRPPANAEQLLADGAPWCLGLGSSPDAGWPGTDWVEDLLLHRSGPEVYRRWASGELAWSSPEVRGAWQTWGALVSGVPAERALLTDFDDAGLAMFTRPQGCGLDHLGSFAGAVYRERGHRGDFAPFPDLGASGWEVSADLAGLFTDSPAARRLLTHLADAEGQRVWPAAGGAYSAHKRVPPSGYADPVDRRIAEVLTEGASLCLDASDLMPPSLRSAFYRGVINYLEAPESLDGVLDGLDHIADSVDRTEWITLPCG
ncbi:extracellular solute-binding protein [Actinosynnema pretiosum subsp. pretiosum]|uniref:Extracellular solute-binding protein n=1 Tax=Actinosynnema pretiosum subsp. pretiosum TaxID=103721 RepID=A0AA45R5E7_9PSEU|nr:Alpha-glucosides-binding periplasmic protein AglE precursor [Actinosynnema pretiosum subsp. pretiosum]QUF05881.1 extracellular solute-binding protein [Actinosynnema pretiosum subsp. pretiosum]